MQPFEEKAAQTLVLLQNGASVDEASPLLAPLCKSLGSAVSIALKCRNGDNASLLSGVASMNLLSCVNDQTLGRLMQCIPTMYSALVSGNYASMVNTVASVIAELLVDLSGWFPRQDSKPQNSDARPQEVVHRVMAMPAVIYANPRGYQPNMMNNLQPNMMNNLLQQVFQGLVPAAQPPPQNALGRFNFLGIAQGILAANNPANNPANNQANNPANNPANNQANNPANNVDGLLRQLFQGI